MSWGDFSIVIYRPQTGYSRLIGHLASSHASFIVFNLGYLLTRVQQRVYCFRASLKQQSTHGRLSRIFQLGDQLYFFFRNNNREVFGRSISDSLCYLHPLHCLSSFIIFELVLKPLLTFIKYGNHKRVHFHTTTSNYFNQNRSYGRIAKQIDTWKP